MQFIEDHYEADEDKTFYRPSDNTVLGTALWLGCNDSIDNYTEVDKPAPPVSSELETAKANKHDEISLACNNVIIAGVDCNGKHYSLTENDQINLASLYNLSLQTPAPALLYHADGELCRVYTVAEIQALMSIATQHKIYQTTYCNHMFAWINRCTTVAEVNAIHYNDTLPTDLLTHLQEVLGIEND